MSREDVAYLDDIVEAAKAPEGDTRPRKRETIIAEALTLYGQILAGELVPIRKGDMRKANLMTTAGIVNQFLEKVGSSRRVGFVEPDAIVLLDEEQPESDMDDPQERMRRIRANLKRGENNDG